LPKVSFSATAQADLFRIYELILSEGGTRRAGAYVVRIERRCSALEVFPLAGRLREDISPGLGTLAFERRILLAYRVLGNEVQIARVLYAGQVLDVSG